MTRFDRRHMFAKRFQNAQQALGRPESSHRRRQKHALQRSNLLAVLADFCSNT